MKLIIERYDNSTRNNLSLDNKLLAKVVIDDCSYEIYERNNSLELITHEKEVYKEKISDKNLNSIIDNLIEESNLDNLRKSKVAVYCRTNKAEEESSDSQREKCEYFLKQKLKLSSYDLYFDKGYRSSDCQSNPAFSALLKYICNKKYHSVLIADLNRLGRDVNSLLKIGDILSKNSCKCYSIREGMYLNDINLCKNCGNRKEEEMNHEKI